MSIEIERLKQAYIVADEAWHTACNSLRLAKDREAKTFAARNAAYVPWRDALAAEAERRDATRSGAGE